MTKAIQLIVGLGNPGAKYQHTRHNAGFDFVDALLPVGMNLREDKRFHGDVGEITVDGRRVWLLKPLTYMNRSGDAVAGLANYFKIPPEQILVVHDELDLPPGQIRLKTGGGSGGHNGLKDIVTKLGGNSSFVRLRVGVGHPGSADQVVGYVLQRAPASEADLTEEAMHRALPLIPKIVAGETSAAMNELHRK